MMAFDKIIYNIILDFIVLLVLGIPLLVVELRAEPFHRGFFVNDETIRLPYVEQTISELAAGLCGFALVIIMIVLTEVVRDRQGTGVGEKFLSGSVVPGWVWESYRGIGVFGFGALCQQVIVTVGKYVIGRLRPHFYTVCNPVFNSSSPLNQLGYITDYKCTGSELEKIEQARLSFPSGHSSFVMYTAVFCIFYLQTKTKWRGSKLCRHAAQFIILMTAWYVGLSRVVENMHHWSDVATGFLIGAAVAAFTFVYILKPKKYGLPVSWQEPVRPPNSLPRPAVAR